MMCRRKPANQVHVRDVWSPTYGKFLYLIKVNDFLTSKTKSTSLSEEFPDRLHKYAKKFGLTYQTDYKYKKSRPVELLDTRKRSWMGYAASIPAWQVFIYTSSRALVEFLLNRRSKIYTVIEVWAPCNECVGEKLSKHCDQGYSYSVSKSPWYFDKSKPFPSVGSMHSKQNNNARRYKYLALMNVTKNQNTNDFSNFACRMFQYSPKRSMYFYFNTLSELLELKLRCAGLIELRESVTIEEIEYDNSNKNLIANQCQ